MDLSMSMGLGTARSKGVGYTGAFDALPAAYGAFSLNRLYRGYDSAVVRLRRSSDDAEQDFSAVAGRLDATAVSAWRGVGDAFITTWYDQTGNGRPAVQTTAANQAKLSVDCRTALFDGTNDQYAVSNSLAYGRNVAGLTGAAFAAIEDKLVTRVLFQTYTPVPNTRFRAIRSGTSGSFAVQARRLDADGATSLIVAGDIGNTIHRLIARRDYAAATHSAMVDGVLTTGAAGTAGSTSDTDSPAGVWLGSSGGADYLKGEAQCFVLFQAALSDGQMTALDAALLSLLTDFGSDFDPDDFV